MVVQLLSEFQLLTGHEKTGQGRLFSNVSLAAALCEARTTIMHHIGDKEMQTVDADDARQPLVPQNNAVDLQMHPKPRSIL